MKLLRNSRNFWLPIIFVLSTLFVYVVHTFAEPSSTEVHINSKATPLWPIQGVATVVSNFGPRLGSNTQGSGFYHEGLDIRAPEDTSVFAANDGCLVTYPLESKVILNSEDENRYQYSHVQIVTISDSDIANNISCSTGRPVRRGATIAKIGSNPAFTHVELAVTSKNGKFEFGSDNPLLLSYEGIGHDPANVSPSFDATAISSPALLPEEWIAFKKHGINEKFFSKTTEGYPIISGNVDIVTVAIDNMGEIFYDATKSPIFRMAVPQKISYFVRRVVSTGITENVMGSETNPKNLITFNSFEHFFKDVQGNIQNQQFLDIVDDIYDIKEPTGLTHNPTGYDYYYFTVTHVNANGKVTANQFWKTNSVDATKAIANGLTLTDNGLTLDGQGQNAAVNSDAMFPDGDYEVHVVAEDLGGHKTDKFAKVRVSNFNITNVKVQPSSIPNTNTNNNVNISFDMARDATIEIALYDDPTGGAQDLVILPAQPFIKGSQQKYTWSINPQTSLLQLVPSKTYYISVKDTQSGEDKRVPFTVDPVEISDLTGPSCQDIYPWITIGHDMEVINYGDPSSTIAPTAKLYGYASELTTNADAKLLRFTKGGGLVTAATLDKRTDLGEGVYRGQLLFAPATDTLGNTYPLVKAWVSTDSAFPEDKVERSNFLQVPAPTVSVTNLQASPREFDPNSTTGVSTTTQITGDILGFTSCEAPSVTWNVNVYAPNRTKPVKTFSGTRIRVDTGAWDGKGDSGNSLADGLYAIKVAVNGGTELSSFASVRIGLGYVPDGQGAEATPEGLFTQNSSIPLPGVSLKNFPDTYVGGIAQLLPSGVNYPVTATEFAWTDPERRPPSTIFPFEFYDKNGKDVGRKYLNVWTDTTPPAVSDFVVTSDPATCTESQGTFLFGTQPKMYFCFTTDELNEFISVEIYDASGTTRLRTLKNTAVNVGGFEGFREEPKKDKPFTWIGWDGRKDDGFFVSPGIYTVKIKVQDVAGNFTKIKTQVAVGFAPVKLTGVYATPKKFSPSLGLDAIHYTLSDEARITITVLDANGNGVDTVANGDFSYSGEQIYYWDGRNGEGRFVPDGTSLKKIYKNFVYGLDIEGINVV